MRLLSPFGVTRADVRQFEHQVITYAQGAGTSVAKGSLSAAGQMLSMLVELVLTLVLSIYITGNGPVTAAWLRREAPDRYRQQVVQVLTSVNHVVGGYVRGTLTMATLIGFLVGGGMAVLGVPFASVLGILAFFMEFVPVIGTLISGAVCVLVALSHGWELAIIVLGYFVLVHVIDAYLVGPRVMGRAVGIHPVTAIIALVAGNELFGIGGALFAAPLAGLLQVFITTLWRDLRQVKREDRTSNTRRHETPVTVVTPPGGQ